MKKILVANRGEIACRVMAALREAGLASVAVHSDADRSALHVRTADEAVEIGAAPAAESYLAIDKILAAAAATGADAVHPGYGFLAENARFAEAVEAAGLVFLGPSPDTIDLLGDKRRARAVAAKAKVPVVPGWEGDPSDRDGARAAAEEMGWPVLVKAALGGGGKGMTRVNGPEELDAALETAARVAASAFGDPSVYLEKLIQRPRHVEVQILGDGKGGVLHLYERECSLQRRHQKVFEESPSSAISEKTRKALTKAAVAIGKQVEYRSAGTVEFLVDADESFWFLEVNARIQVEHPVTELVTGRDIVRAQLAIAETGELPCAQEEIAASGVAIEARLYAEDPDSAFLPQAGDLLRVELPSGPWIRVDGGVVTGDTVSTHYDPMLAKIVAYGADRETAWHRLTRALEQTVVHGPITNLDFLREVSSRPDVVAGDYHTQSIEHDWLPERERRLASGAEDLLAIAAALADRFDLTGDGAAATSAGGDRAARSRPLRDPGRLETPMKAVYRRAGGDAHEVLVEAKGPLVAVAESGEVRGEFRVVPLGPGRFRMSNGKRTWRVCVDRDGTFRHVTIEGEGEARFEREVPGRRGARDTAGGGLSAPMPGTVVKVLVAAGDTVEKGQELLVIEAMKMEFKISAPVAGTVSSVAAAEGDPCDAGQVLAEIEPAGRTE